MTMVDPQAKRGRKYDQVLDGARDIFLRDGFDQASMDNVAQAAKVSKATLYSYFKDKQTLFSEVVQRECARQRETALAEIDQSKTVPEVLYSAGMRLTDFLTSAVGQRIFRISIAETERFPEIGQSFYESGPTVMRIEMGAYLSGAMAAGQLKIDDIDLAIDQFAELCKADYFIRLHTGVTQSVTEQERDRVVRGAVEMFMARYGV